MLLYLLSYKDTRFILKNNIKRKKIYHSFQLKSLNHTIFFIFKGEKLYFTVGNLRFAVGNIRFTMGNLHFTVGNIKFSIVFCTFPFDLNKILIFRNENNFSFLSLTRIFAVPLSPESLWQGMPRASFLLIIL